MAKNRRLGLDIGSYKVVAVIGHYNDANKWEIEACERSKSSGVLRGEIIDVDAAVRSLKEVLSKLKEKGFNIPKSANVCIGGQFTKNAKCFGYVQKTENTVFSQKVLQEIIPTVSQPLKVPEETDYLELLMYIRRDRESFEKFPVGKEGKKFTAFYNKVYGQASSLNKLQNVLQQCDIELGQVLLKPEAIAHSVLENEERRDGVALLDIGAGTTSVIVYEGDMLRYSAILPFGGNTITSDISKKFAISMRDAESIKSKYGSCFAKYVEDESELIQVGDKLLNLNMKELARVIQFRAQELIDSILYQVQKSECKDKLLSGFVLTGGGAQLEHFDKLLKAMDGKKVRLAAVKSNFVVGNEISNPSYTTAIASLTRVKESQNRGKKSSMKSFVTKLFS